MVALPSGFRSFVTNVGIKDNTDDFTVVAADTVVAAAGVFTLSRFAGPSVLVSRRHVSDHRARAVVVISKNANVATGEQGMANALEVVKGVGERLGCDPHDVLIASTGVIGRQYPIERVRAGLAALPTELPGSSAADADVDGDTLDAVWRRVIDRTFNCVSVDTDTSTSDTAIVLASGAAGPVDVAALETALEDVARSLTKQVARDGEGAETLIEVCVDGARDAAQAKTVAKAIVNSPLVKTAVHGADPNWGRVAMAVGKCSDYTDIDQENVVIRFGDQEVYPVAVDESGLMRLSDYMRGDEVRIHVTLNIGNASSTVWGCDLTDGYVRINADYTT